MIGPAEDESSEVTAKQVLVIQAIRVPDHPGTGRMSANRMRGTTKIGTSKRGEDRWKVWGWQLEMWTGNTCKSRTGYLRDFCCDCCA
jgi:hypothetical protein